MVADIQIHVLQCKNHSEATEIMNYVNRSAPYAKHYAQPIPWQDFKCTKYKTVFVATRTETHEAAAGTAAATVAGTEVVGWAICYTYSYPVCKYAYLSSISTMRGENGKAKYRNVGTLVMNKILETFQTVDFIMLLPINGTEPFYSKFGFHHHGSDLMFRLNHENENVEHAIFWNDEQLTTVDAMLMEYEGQLPKRTFLNFKRFMTQFSMSTQPHRADLFRRFIEDYQNGSLEKVDIVNKTPKRSRRV